MQVLITGGGGFVGGHLKTLLEQKYAVLVTSRKNSGPGTLTLDLKDVVNTSKCLQNSVFDTIIHLASQSSVHRSHLDPFTTLSDNIQSTLNLLRAAEWVKPPPAIILAGTAEIYKSKPGPISESDELEPKNPYAISKFVTDRMATHPGFFKNVNVTSLRLFNHTGPGQSDTFVLGSFTRQIAEIKMGKSEPVLKVGNLEAVRDFLDVRDVCRAYEAVSLHPDCAGIYNVCSGNSWRIRDLLDMLIEISGIKISVKTDSEKMRPSDIPVFTGDNSRFSEMFSWKPQIEMEQTLRDMLDWWTPRL